MCVPSLLAAMTVRDVRVGRCPGAQVALSLANLAALMRAQGRHAQAEEHLRRALSIREDALGPDHPLVCIPFTTNCHANQWFSIFGWMTRMCSLPNWRVTVLCSKRCPRACSWPHCHVCGTEMQCRPELCLLPWQVAGSYAALASLLRAANRPEEALTYAKVALEAKERAFPPGHSEIAAALLALADLLREQAR